MCSRCSRCSRELLPLEYLEHIEHSDYLLLEAIVVRERAALLVERLERVLDALEIATGECRLYRGDHVGSRHPIIDLGRRRVQQTGHRVTGERVLSATTQIQRLHQRDVRVEAVHAKGRIEVGVREIPGRPATDAVLPE